MAEMEDTQKHTNSYSGKPDSITFLVHKLKLDFHTRVYIILCF